MLDRDLAILYGVETRALNRAVKRNSGRFPSDFVLELDRDEIMRISQSVISSPDLKFSKRVFAFTEQGVAMLSGVLHSPQAVEVNVAIMRAFVRLREYLASPTKLSLDGVRCIRTKKASLPPFCLVFSFSLLPMTTGSIM